MTISTKDYAALDKDSYNVPEVDKVRTVDGIDYYVIDYYNNPITGYQGTAYQRVDTKEVVIASRGTEPSGGTAQDAMTDLGMVITCFNAQLPDARAVAKRVKEKIEFIAEKQGYPLPTITVTGHSLGGALTEALAYENHWRGETFNGFGAVDLQYSIPEGGTQVINHVRVTDVVSAANRHFGEVRYYATQEDIDTLTKAGYTDATHATSLRNPFGAIRLSAHSINNFAPDNPALTTSDLSLENQARAQAHRHGIVFWRSDIHALRSNTLSAGWQLAHKSETAHNLLWEAGKAALHGDFHKVESIADLARQRTDHNLSSAGETALNTAALYAKGVQHVIQYVDDRLREGVNEAWQAGERVHHEAAQTWSRTSRAMDAATDAIKDKVAETGQAIGDAAMRTSNAMDRTTDAIKHQVQETYGEVTYGEIKHNAQELHHQAQVAVDSAVQHAAKAAQHSIDVIHRKAQAAGDAASSAAYSVSDGLSQVGTKLGSLFGDDKPVPSLNHPTHPDHAFYNDALKAVKHLDASQGRTPDHRSERLAAALMVAGRREGLSGIDHAVLSDDASRTFCIQGEPRSTSMRIASVDTAWAVRTPIEQHSRDWQQLVHAHHEAQQQLQYQDHLKAQPLGPAHRM